MPIIFSKLLSPTDVNRRCTVPMEYFRKKSFPKSKYFKVADEGDHEWTLCCYTRRGKDPNHPKHPKPVLIKNWIAFVKSKNLQEGDRVTIYKEQDERGSTYYKIKAEKQTRPCQLHVMNNSNKGSSNSDNQATATFQPSGDLSPSVLNHDPGITTSTTSASIDEEKTPTSHHTSKGIACHKTERPSLSLSLELTPKPTMKWGATAATSSSSDKEQILNPNSTSKDMEFYKTRSNLNLSLGLTLKTTLTEGEQHAYTQGTIPRTLDFLASFPSVFQTKQSYKTG